MDVVLVAAVARNRVIGCEGRIPWRISEDLEHFRSLTVGAPVIMGRRTFESIGHPLPDRLNIVLSSNVKAAGVRVCNSLEDAFHMCRDFGVVFVIGGQSVFEQAMDSATRLEITHIDLAYEGDAFFPVIDASWRKVREDKREGYSFVAYVR